MSSSQEDAKPRGRSLAPRPAWGSGGGASPRTPTSSPAAEAARAQNASSQALNPLLKKKPAAAAGPRLGSSMTNGGPDRLTKSALPFSEWSAALKQPPAPSARTRARTPPPAPSSSSSMARTRVLEDGWQFSRKRETVSPLRAAATSSPSAVRPPSGLRAPAERVQAAGGSGAAAVAAAAGALGSAAKRASTRGGAVWTPGGRTSVPTTPSVSSRPAWSSTCRAQSQGNQEDPPSSSSKPQPQPRVKPWGSGPSATAAAASTPAPVPPAPVPAGGAEPRTPENSSAGPVMPGPSARAGLRAMTTPATASASGRIGSTPRSASPGPRVVSAQPAAVAAVSAGSSKAKQELQLRFPASSPGREDTKQGSARKEGSSYALSWSKQQQQQQQQQLGLSSAAQPPAKGSQSALQPPLPGASRERVAAFVEAANKVQHLLPPEKHAALQAMLARLPAVQQQLRQQQPEAAAVAAPAPAVPSDDAEAPDLTTPFSPAALPAPVVPPAPAAVQIPAAPPASASERMQPLGRTSKLVKSSYASELPHPPFDIFHSNSTINLASPQPSHTLEDGLEGGLIFSTSSSGRHKQPAPGPGEPWMAWWNGPGPAGGSADSDGTKAGAHVSFMRASQTFSDGGMSSLTLPDSNNDDAAFYGATMRTYSRDRERMRESVAAVMMKGQEQSLLPHSSNAFLTYTVPDALVEGPSLLTLSKSINLEGYRSVGSPYSPGGPIHPGGSSGGGSVPQSPTPSRRFGSVLLGHWEEGQHLEAPAGGSGMSLQRDMSHSPLGGSPRAKGRSAEAAQGTDTLRGTFQSPSSPNSPSKGAGGAKGGAGRDRGLHSSFRDSRATTINPMATPDSSACHSRTGSVLAEGTDAPTPHPSWFGSADASNPPVVPRSPYTHHDSPTSLSALARATSNSGAVAAAATGRMNGVKREVFSSDPDLGSSAASSSGSREGEGRRARQALAALGAPNSAQEASGRGPFVPRISEEDMREMDVEMLYAKAGLTMSRCRNEPSLERLRRSLRDSMRNSLRRSTASFSRHSAVPEEEEQQPGPGSSESPRSSSQDGQQQPLHHPRHPPASALHHRYQHRDHNHSGEDAQSHPQPDPAPVLYGRLLGGGLEIGQSGDGVLTSLGASEANSAISLSRGMLGPLKSYGSSLEGQFPIQKHRVSIGTRSSGGAPSMTGLALDSPAREPRYAPGTASAALTASRQAEGALPASNLVALQHLLSEAGLRIVQVNPASGTLQRGTSASSSPRLRGISSLPGNAAYQASSAVALTRLAGRLDASRSPGSSHAESVVSSTGSLGSGLVPRRHTALVAAEAGSFPPVSYQGQAPSVAPHNRAEAYVESGIGSSSSSPARQHRATQAGQLPPPRGAELERHGGTGKAVGRRRSGARNTTTKRQQQQHEHKQGGAAAPAASGPRRRRLGAAIRRKLGVVAGALRPLGRFQGALAELVAVAVAGAAGGLLVHSSLEDRHDRINYL